MGYAGEEENDRVFVFPLGPVDMVGVDAEVAIALKIILGDPIGGEEPHHIYEELMKMDDLLFIHSRRYQFVEAAL